MNEMQDKVVFITGAARGQGRSHAVRLAEEGAKIIGIDVCEKFDTVGYPMPTPDDLEQTADLVRATGSEMHSTVVDVRDRAGLSSAIADGFQRFGRLDGVVAQAGVCPLGNEEPQGFLDAITVNFGGVVNTVEAALPFLHEGGSIVATGSIAALINSGGSGSPSGNGGLGYSLSKRMIASFVNDASIVLGPHNIRVNALHPGSVNTDMLNNDVIYRQFRPDLPDPTREDALEVFPRLSGMNVPYVEPQDISEMVLYLLSDRARYVTGTQMRVDAGFFVTSRPQEPPF